jgi:nicotinamide-nucleotide amidase
MACAAGFQKGASRRVPLGDRARLIRERFGASWGIGETGATGPTGNRYGDPAGHACLAVSGRSERAITMQTGSSDRIANMYAFAAAALQLFHEVLTP